MRGLIIGFGQDAKLLAIALQKKGIFYKILCKTSTVLNPFIPDFIKKKHLLFGDGTDLNCLLAYCRKYHFTHIYNVAGNTFSQSSNTNFFQYLNSNTQILTNIIVIAENNKNLWVYHPLSSEILASNEHKDLLQPRNAYGVSKTAEYYISTVANTNGANIFYPVLFNHESFFRSKKFFSSKLISFLIERQDRILEIWNTSSSRDWGSASQYMDLILSASIKNKTGFGHLGTSKTYTVAEIVTFCLRHLKIKFKEGKTNKNLIYWKLEDGRSIIEKNRDINDAKRVVKANTKEVNQAFGKHKLIHGKELINILFEEYNTFNRLDILERETPSRKKLKEIVAEEK